MMEQVLTVAGALLAAEEEPALQLLHHHVLQKVTNLKFQHWIWYNCSVDIYSLGTEENIDLILPLQHDVLQNLTNICCYHNQILLSSEILYSGKESILPFHLKCKP